jgi:hypothetical protein
MNAPEAYDIYNQDFDDAVLARSEPLDPLKALETNTAGHTIVSVSGTAIAGTRTAATTFTRSSGVWIKRVVIDISSVSGTFQVGETVTETTSSATGVIESVTASKMYLTTITAEFVGEKTLTGGTSGATATGGASPVNAIDDQTGKVAWSHASGTLTAGSWCLIKSNTKDALTLEHTLHATGTAVIIADSPREARLAMDISYGS